MRVTCLTGEVACVGSSLKEPTTGQSASHDHSFFPVGRRSARVLATLQRLFAEGEFTATYKYAQLIVLSDLAVELGTDDGAALTLTTRQLAERFVHLYWRHASPYGTGRPRLAALRTQLQARGRTYSSERRPQLLPPTRLAHPNSSSEAECRAPRHRGPAARHSRANPGAKRADANRH
jgi:hypothetical protein